jgi:hypothetical protein
VGSPDARSYHFVDDDPAYRHEVLAKDYCLK